MNPRGTRLPHCGGEMGVSSHGYHLLKESGRKYSGAMKTKLHAACQESAKGLFMVDHSLFVEIFAVEIVLDIEEVANVPTGAV